MADVEGGRTLTLSEQYLLKDKEEKPDGSTKPVEVTDAASDEVASEKIEDTPAGEESTEASPAGGEESTITPAAAAEETTETTAAAAYESNEANPAASEESSEINEQEDSGDQEAEQTPEIKLETAPADFRFPTTNQTRHCFTRYIEYHRCIAAKGEDAPECDKFAKYYRSLCPGEWIERWNEQRENGTFPGPL
ncbi:cytochrome c oxidase subunit 6b-1 [Malania oleifera]|uniref:cytochrome c oxidase subunit 6b-1 n=1 Tax=Malania oleifera TaxID=397392 RepID=UPI0025AEB792|nr:cytochrome c oxidase subunit 6b-1 [Malania oleifera]